MASTTMRAIASVALFALGTVRCELSTLDQEPGYVDGEQNADSVRFSFHMPLPSLTSPKR